MALSIIQGVNVQAALVDLDGTLVDTVGDFVATLNATLAELALPEVDPAFVMRTVGKGSEYLVRRTLLEIAGHDEQYAQAFAAYQRLYDRFNGLHSRVYPGVPEALALWRARGWKLGCLTNKPTTFAKALLRSKGLDGFFQVVYGGDAFERKKPDPLPLVKGCEALGSLHARTLMVGDSSNDAAAARAAGCPVVLVSYGYNHGEPVTGVDCDGVIDRLDQL